MVEQIQASPTLRDWKLGLPYPVRNLLRRSRGMFGMIVGVGLAIGMVMTLLAISTASVEVYSGDYVRSGADLYLITRGGTLIPVLPSDSPGTIRNARYTLARVRGDRDVRAALGVMNWSMTRERELRGPMEDRVEVMATMGVDGDPTTMPDAVVLQRGRWLRRTNEVVIGPQLSRERSIDVGETVRLDDRDFLVVGVGKIRGVGFGAEAVAYLDYQALRQRAQVGDVVNMIIVDATDPVAVRDRLRDLDDLEVLSTADLVRQSEEVNVASYAFSWILSFLALAIGAIFVSSMLARSVAERRLEFATLRAIGVPTRLVMVTVGAEALLVTTVATVIGMAISMVFGVLLNQYVAPEYGLESLYSADPGLFLLVFAIAVGLGLLSGFFPARQATRVEPVEVLREA